MQNFQGIIIFIIIIIIIIIIIWIIIHREIFKSALVYLYKCGLFK